jgi:hypothetical protein
MGATLSSAAGLARVGLQVTMDFVMINVIDYAPDHVRRKILKAEYEGEVSNAYCLSTTRE